MELVPKFPMEVNAAFTTTYLSRNGTLSWRPHPISALGSKSNSFAGVAWVSGKHDRAWFERPVFGKVRYMPASRLERKCDIGAYVHEVDHRVRGINSA